MDKYEIIIKDKNGNEVNKTILAESFSKDNITIISPILDTDNDEKAMFCQLLMSKLKEFGLKNFLVFPIRNKDEGIKIQKIKLTD